MAAPDPRHIDPDENILRPTLQPLASELPLTLHSVEHTVRQPMKTVTAREFYHSSKLVDDLRAGEQLVVTAKGKPKFIVSHVGTRPKMTRELAETLAIDAGTPEDFDSVAFLRSLIK